MNDSIKVTKRDGSHEQLMIEKIKRQVSWAAEGLDVSTSQVELDMRVNLYNGIPTTEIHEALIKSAANLISVDEPDYQLMAARLVLFNIRKQAYNDFTPPTIYNQVKEMVEKGIYDKTLLEDYSEEDFQTLELFIDHSRDMNIRYAGMVQIASKYLVQHRVTKIPYESPQMAFMLIAMCLFSGYKERFGEESRLKQIKAFYDAVSTFQISLPSPIMGGVRTPTKQYSSCVLLSSDDSLNSLMAVSNSIIQYISQRAGIGLDMSAIRGEGAAIRNGEAEHTGVIPFYKLMQAAVKSCSQGKHCPV